MAVNMKGINFVGSIEIEKGKTLVIYLCLETRFTRVSDASRLGPGCTALLEGARCVLDVRREAPTPMAKRVCHSQGGSQRLCYGKVMAHLLTSSPHGGD